MTLDSTRAPISGILYPTENYRMMIQSVLGGATAQFAGGPTGYDASQGVVRSGDLLVTANGTPDMTVTVAAGAGFVRGTESALQGSYPFFLDASIEDIPIPAADATNTRRDIVGIHVSDSNYGSTDPEDDGVFVEVISGTPSSSPADPTLPDNFLPLARVVVAALDTAISSGEITDMRVRARPWNAAWGQIAAVSSTSLSTSTTTAVDLLSVVAAPRSLRLMEVRANVIIGSTVTGDEVRAYTTVDVDSLGAAQFTSTAGKSQSFAPVADWTSDGSSHTFKVGMARISGSGTLQVVSAVEFPTRLKVVDLGPAA